MDTQALSFSRLRALADVLRLTSTTPRHLRPFAAEVFRSQTAFNHRVVDVLEDAVWTAPLPDHAARVEHRLGALAELRADIPRRRAGLEGDLVFVAKYAGLAVLRRALAAPLALRTQANRALIEALKAIPGKLELERFRAHRLLGLERWFEAQMVFYEAVNAFVTGLGDSLTSYAAGFARFGHEYEHAVKARWNATGAKARVVVQLVGEGTPECLRALGTSTIVTQPEGDVVVRLPGDELLAGGALDVFAEVFATRPEVQLCYGDTFFTETGTAAFKPGWSPEYLLSTNYVGGCFAVRSELAKRLPLDGPAAACLLATPLKDSEVVRIPWVLSLRARPPIVEVNREVRFPVEGTPQVTIIVPFKDRPELLRGLWNSLRRHDAGLPFALVLVSNQSVEAETYAFLEQVRDPRVSWFEWNAPFNWSAINNAAAAKSKSELLLFLNNDIEVTHDGWLRDLAGFALHPELGVAGARLLYEDRSVQHAGVVIGLRGLAGHVFARWRPEYGPTPFGAPELTRNWSAVTGACLMIRRALFEELGGFDEGIRVSGGDVELCVRVRARGLRVVCVGHVELLHYESISRGADPVPDEDLKREATAYAELLKTGDPYYHPQLSAEVGHGGLGPLLETAAEHAAGVIKRQP